jgi:ssDNA-binding Zn-finger/Zn-ribbon topoisomerase 1
MPKCPHCQTAIVVRHLKHQGMFKSYRICPDCKGEFEVDSKTKKRQAICVVVALLALLFTGLLYYQGTHWLIPTIVSNCLLVAIIYWGNKQVHFVPYHRRS